MKKRKRREREREKERKRSTIHKVETGGDVKENATRRAEGWIQAQTLTINTQ